MLRAYDPEESQAGHLAAAITYTGVVTGAAVVARSRGVTAPRVSPWDTAAVALATYKAARLLAKDKVTAPLRAPFTRRTGAGVANEVNDVPRGAGVQRTLGELMACPFCLGQWIATGFAVGLVFAPGPTRLVATTLAAVAGADFLHHAYCAMQQMPGALEARARTPVRAGSGS